MANVANPRGFSPINPIIRMTYYTKGTAAAMFPGDLVGLRPDGKVYHVATGTTTNLGVVMSYKTATDTRVLIADHPDQQYYIQDDGVGGTLAATGIGAGFNVVMTAGNGTFFKSAQSLDTSTLNAATGARSHVLLGFHPDDEVGKYVRCRVRLKPAANIIERAAFV